MEKVVACYKWVLNEDDIRISPDLSIDMSKAKGKISPYDKNAIETAVQLANKIGGQAVTLTFGTASVKASVKDALSRGPEEGYWINAPQAVEADNAVTARALAAAIRKIDDVKLVICAEGANDTYARQTAPRIGALLDWPVITSVIAAEITGNTMQITRRLNDCLEKVEVEMPAVLAILPEIYDAPLPGLKAVMKAAKLPVTEFKDDDLNINFRPAAKVKAVKGYFMQRKNLVFQDGTAQEKVSKLVAELRREGVL